MTTTNQKYAVNEAKQAELDTLSAQVTRAEYQVEQLSAIVDSLTAKQATFTTQLNTADADRAAAQSNLDMVKQVVAGIKEMVRKAHTVRQQTEESNHNVQEAAAQLSDMVNKLIFSIELLDKLTVLINKKQETRVVISADLVTTIATANSDANNALALTLTALNSCFAAMSSGSESLTVTTLEYIQSLQLYGLITGNNGPVNDLVTDTKNLEASTRAFDEAKFKLDEAIRQAGYKGKLTDYTSQEGPDAVQAQLESAINDAKEALALAQNDHKSAIEQLKNANDKNADELAANVSQAKAQIDKLNEQYNNLLALLEAFKDYVIARKQYEEDKAQFEASVQALNETFAQFSQNPPQGNSLYKLLEEANEKAKIFYDYSLLVLDKVNRELTQAQAGLLTAQTNLASLQAGLAAATAAALAA